MSQLLKSAGSFAQRSLDGLAEAVYVDAPTSEGDILFAKGDAASEMFCTLTGKFRLKETELDRDRQPVGELGCSLRAIGEQTLECIEDGEILTISEQVAQLYFQNQNDSISCGLPQDACFKLCPSEDEMAHLERTRSVERRKRAPKVKSATRARRRAPRRGRCRAFSLSGLIHADRDCLVSAGRPDRNEVVISIYPWISDVSTLST